MLQAGGAQPIPLVEPGGQNRIVRCIDTAFTHVRSADASKVRRGAGARHYTPVSEGDAMPLDEFDFVYKVSVWDGLPVRCFEVPVAGLRDALPDFELRHLSAPPNDNPRMRLIVRMPQVDDPHERPSRRSRTSMICFSTESSRPGSNAADAGLGAVTASVLVTCYGERLRVTIPLDDRERDPFANHDRFRPEIEITNSVDKSSAFRVAIRWRWLVCLNGMFTVEEDRMRSVHHVDLSRTHLVRAFLEERLSRESDALSRLRAWKSAPIKAARAQTWCEERLRERGGWSVENCAPLWAILDTGYDGRVTAPRRVGVRHLLSAYRVGQDRRVPGGKLSDRDGERLRPTVDMDHDEATLGRDAA